MIKNLFTAFSCATSNNDSLVDVSYTARRAFGEPSLEAIKNSLILSHCCTFNFGPNEAVTLSRKSISRSLLLCLLPRPRAKRRVYITESKAAALNYEKAGQAFFSAFNRRESELFSPS